MVRAREVANTLKEWISAGRFLLGEPVELLPSVEVPSPDPETVSRES
jgi:uncharacterized protein (DUF39 family)